MATTPVNSEAEPAPRAADSIVAIWPVAWGHRYLLGLLLFGAYLANADLTNFAR